MNFKTRALVLLVFLDFTKSSSTERLSTTRVNKISINRGASINVNVTLGAIRDKKISSSTSSSTRTIFKTNKRWKIGRMTNKQFGIVNVMWQKTKVFIDQDYSKLTCKATTIETTPDVKKQIVSKKGATKISSHKGKLQISTPSYIEFYYLDQADDRIKFKNSSNTKLQKVKKSNRTTTHRGNNKKPVPSVFKININTVRRKYLPQPTKSVHKVGQGSFYRNKVNKQQTTLVSKSPLKMTTKSKIKSSKQQQKPKKNQSHQTVNIFTKSTPVNARMRQESKVSQNKNNVYTTKLVTDTTYLVPSSTSTAYDKVKFFETYDSYTPRLKNYIISKLSNVSYDNNEAINTRDDERILLHHVIENIGHHQDKNKTRHVKKHIQDLYSKEITSKNEMNISKYRLDLKFRSSTSKFQVPFQKNSTSSRPTVWTDFPFVAVYIYEPSQVRCDAAGISPHWLLGAASCLSRYRRGLRGGLSAFVTFCGDNWRHPQMISYVKRTLIHPLYHPKDKIRHLFNAGLIQVVNSMADTCSGWGPASLMSHQYTADEKGSIGTAVGWGLDRYDVSYSATNIPSHALVIYEGRVYSEICPGSTEYSEARSSDEVDVRNVYCLLLPPYLAEENDTVHGALLLIGGKLLALYLKEERRPWGEQSAQYTGIWRLLPWVAETAREPDDSFHFEI